ncbi:MAG: 5'/3'-nucleotidase SurE [Gammaproteobacteria bacterium]|nr:5'/3'-nucleotidase SurE [Gammaproteobacteria bacterium]
MFSINSKKMKILLTNDDGFEAPGILQLYESLKDKYEVFFLAPKENMSGKGSAITVWDQPSFQNHGNGIHSLNGTPVDCVKYAINFYCPFAPDLVVSGINPGPNLGTDIFFSGTVGAALEGRNLKYPSIALSANSFELNDYSHQVKISEKIIEKVDQLEFHSQCILNVNIPNYSDNSNPKVDFTVPSLEINENSISEDRQSLEKGNISISALTPILYSHDNNDIARSWAKNFTIDSQ